MIFFELVDLHKSSTDDDQFLSLNLELNKMDIDICVLLQKKQKQRNDVDSFNLITGVHVNILSHKL